MALPSYYTPAQPYRQPSIPGQQVQNQLYAQLAAGNAAAAAVPPRLPYGEFGANTSAPARVGDTGATSPFSATRGNLGDQSQPAPAAATGSSNNNSGPGFSMPGFEDDPILAKTKALWARNVSQAEEAALAGRKQAEIGYGYDPNYTYADQSTQQAAQQNAFSDLASLLYNHTERAYQTDEGLNKGNLFYSGERARQLGREGRQYTLEQVLANQGLQGKLTGISNAVMQTRMAAQEAELQAQENAYNRALQFALQYGTGLPGGGGGGGGFDTTDFLRNAPGSTDVNAVHAAAAAHAPTYNGQQFVPSNIAQEGVAPAGYQWIKFIDPTGRQGSSTELVPVG